MPKKETSGMPSENEDKASIKKKRATAMEIDKVQSKRRVMPKTVVKRQKIAVKVVRPPRDIGIDVPPPKESCEDPNCPFHGTLSVRGQTMDVVVVSDKMQKSAVVKREYFHPIKKYERLEKRTSKFLVHSPVCIGATAGDRVKIVECRPLSKTKSFVIIQRL